MPTELTPNSKPMKPQTWLKLAGYLVAIVIFFFLFKSLRNNWDQIDWKTLRFNPLYLSASFILAAAGFLVSTYCWKLIMIELGGRVSFQQVFHIMASTVLGKYVPGGVWLTASRLYLAEKSQLPKSLVFLSLTIEQVYVVATALVLAISFLGFEGSLLHLNLPFENLLVLLLVVAVLNPYSLNFLLRVSLKTFRADATGVVFRKRLYVLLILGYGASWLLQGLGFFALVNSFYPLEIIWLKKVLGVYLLSWTIGFLAVFAPGGLGVREGALALVLREFMPFGLALTIGIVSRLWISILEIGLTVAAFALRKR